MNNRPERSIYRLLYPSREDRRENKAWQDEMADSIGAVAGGVMAIFILLFFVLIFLFS